MAMNRPGAKLAAASLVASVGRLRNWRMRSFRCTGGSKESLCKTGGSVAATRSICGPAGLSKPSTCRDRAGCVPVVLLYTSTELGEGLLSLRDNSASVMPRCKALISRYFTYLSINNLPHDIISRPLLPLARNRKVFRRFRAGSPEWTGHNSHKRMS